MISTAPIAGDSALYFGMGRSLLNGLVPRTDLFETKTPVVFWLAAFSLSVSGGNLVYHIVLLASVAGLISKSACDRVGGILLGCSLGLYIIFRGDAGASDAAWKLLQTEGCTTVSSKISSRRR